MNRLLKVHRAPTTMRTAVAYLAVIFFFSTPLFAGSQTGADFLKIPVGAEAAGVGEAYTAMATGINALNWNPAGIVHTPFYLNNPSIGVSLSRQDQVETSLDHLGLIVPSRRFSRTSFGVDLIRLSYADVEQRDENRQVTGSLGTTDLAIGAAIAHSFGHFQVGTQLKIIRQELAGSQANGMAVDLGLLSTTPSPRVSMGLSVRNLGPQMKFNDQPYNLPLTISIGTAFRVTNPLTLAMDVHYKPHQRQTVFSLGTQLAATGNITLRAGYLAKLAETVQNNQPSETNHGNPVNIGGLAGGLGLRYRQFNIDYSITPFGELGNVQMLTLSTWFGEQEKKKPTFNSSDDDQTAANDRTILDIPIEKDQWWDNLQK